MEMKNDSISYTEYQVWYKESDRDIPSSWHYDRSFADHKLAICRANLISGIGRIIVIEKKYSESTMENIIFEKQDYGTIEQSVSLWYTLFNTN